MVKLFFCSDIHGAESVWKKFLNTADYFKADILIMGGDITGKKIVPIISQPNGIWKSHSFTISQKDIILRSEEEVIKFEEQAHNFGYYPYRTTPEEAEILSSNESRINWHSLVKDGPLDKLFKELECKTLQRWLDMIDELKNGSKRVPDDTRIVICPGNDDRFEIDDILKQDSRVIYGEKQKIDLDDNHEMICYGWTTPTPWDTYRETTEKSIEKSIDNLAVSINNLDNSVFCLHCPPYGSLLDTAPILTEDLRPVWGADRTGGGKPKTKPVGSRGVWNAIKKFQPLLSLHGHIHESPGRMKIGRTYCVNPGSAYSENILKGFLIELQSGKITKLNKVEA